MKQLFKNKFFLTLIALLALGASSTLVYLKVLKKSDTDNIAGQSYEIKVDSLLGYIGSEPSYSKFNNLVGMFDASKYLVKSADGLDPSLIIFAPNNDAFNKEEMKPFDSLNAEAREQLKLYHMTKIYPSAQGVAVDLTLKDSQKITTFSGRELTIKKTTSKTLVIDGKGREALVNGKYATSQKGDRIYFIDNVLLFQ